MKILLVDDDAFLRDMYAAKFAEEGDEVDAAKDGHETLRKLDQGEYDVILLDMVMPGLAGVELINEIRQHEKGKTIKCIVLSNKGDEADINEATEAGAIGYIVKAEAIPSEVVSRVKELVA